MSESLTDLVKRGLAAVGLELWGLVWSRASKRAHLVVYCDKEGGVNLEDCTQASRQLSALLDAEGGLDESYVLDVSSPGIEPRLFTLEQCQRFVGSKLALTLAHALEGRSRLVGVLQGVNKGDLNVEVEGQSLVLPFASLKRVQVTGVVGLSKGKGKS